MKEAALQNIKLVLEEMGYPVELAPMSESLPVQQLSVALDVPEGLQLILFFLGDLVKQVGENESGAALAEEQTDFLQLFIRFPFELQESAFADLSRLILRINWSTPVGAFGLNEAQKNLHYRQVFECLGDSLDMDLVADAVSAMEFYAGLRFEILKTVASGEKSLAQVLTELEDAGLQKEIFPGYDL